jgi:hypothetical protein
MVAALVRCTGEEPARGKDTATVVEPPPVEPEPVVPPLAWDTAAGLVFAVATDVAGQALLVDATYSDRDRLDTLHLQGSRIDALALELLAGGDSVGAARVASVGEVSSTQCTGWPVADLAPATGAGSLPPWRVGFAAGRVSPVPFDSLPMLASRDSADRTVAVARASSRAEGDTAAAFRGRPYVVRQASRVAFDDVEILFAEVARTVQQEANPLHEQLVLVLERTGRGRDPYVVRYQERSIGPEEDAAAIELLLAFKVARSGRPALLLRRDAEDGTSFVLLQRTPSGPWAARWRSALATC